MDLCEETRSNCYLKYGLHGNNVDAGEQIIKTAKFEASYADVLFCVFENKPCKTSWMLSVISPLSVHRIIHDSLLFLVKLTAIISYFKTHCTS